MLLRGKCRRLTSVHRGLGRCLTPPKSSRRRYGLVSAWCVDAMAGLPPRAASPPSKDSRPLTLFAPNDGSSYVIVSAEQPRPKEMLVIGERAAAVPQQRHSPLPHTRHQGLAHAPYLVPRAQTARAAACESRPRASLT